MDGIDLMASALQAARARLELSAANLANVSSGGFERRVARVTLERDGLRVQSTVDRKQGPLERTGRLFDLAAVGGWFWVRPPRGAAVPERSASFTLDAAGRLIDERGRMLLGEHGPLRANAGEDVADRVRRTNGATIQSGFLERSNVDAIGEMVDVLSAQRAFETAEKTLGALDETRAKDANDVARVKS